MRPITVRTFMAFLVNRAIDRNAHIGVTVHDVKERIRDGSIFRYLETRIHGLGLSDVSNEMRADLLREWRDMEVTLNESSKLGIEKNGFCLLLGYLLEGIQRTTRAE
jgi:hypothetical protein